MNNELTKVTSVEMGGYSFTISVSRSVLYNCRFDFDQGSWQQDTVGNVGAAIQGASPYIKLQYNQVAAPDGMPANMLLMRGFAELMSIDATQDYVGSQFEYTDANGSQTVVFQDGIVQIN